VKGHHPNGEQFMKPKDLVALGLPLNCVEAAFKALRGSGLIRRSEEARDCIAKLLLAPETYIEQAHLGELAEAVIACRAKRQQETAGWGNNPYGPASGFAH
jgi:hypothetical protein